jgi:hypothetical protein
MIGGTAIREKNQGFGDEPEDGQDRQDRQDRQTVASPANTGISIGNAVFDSKPMLLV